MFDSDRLRQLGDYLSLFKPKGRRSGGSKRAGKRKAVKTKTVAKKSGAKKTKTIKARKSGGQRSVRRTQKKVSRSRSKKS